MVQYTSFGEFCENTNIILYLHCCFNFFSKLKTFRAKPNIHSDSLSEY